jgi:SCP-2 sterol transfer family protein
MNRHTAEAMASVPRTGYDARYTSLQGTACFKVEGVGSWRLRIDDGHFDVFVGDGDADADLVLSLDQETFIELIAGRQNFLTGVLQGRIRAEGDLALAFRFRGIFPLGQGPSTPVL